MIDPLLCTLCASSSSARRACSAASLRSGSRATAPLGGEPDLAPRRSSTSCEPELPAGCGVRRRDGRRRRGGAGRRRATSSRAAPTSSSTSPPSSPARRRRISRRATASTSTGRGCLLDGDPRGRRRLPPAGRLRVVDRRVRGAVPRGDRRRPVPDAADELRDAEGDRRAAALRLHAGAASSTASASGCRRSASGPGKPNRAASGFFSSIIREPLNGQEAVLPVADDVRHWHASPRAAVDFLLHAATIDSDALGDRRCLTMPGVSVTVAEQIAALRSVAGDEAVAADPARARRDRDADRRGLAAQLRRAARDARSASARRRASTRSSASTSRTSSAAGSQRRLVTRVALVTGAGSGIGRAVGDRAGGRRLHRRPRRPAPRAARGRRRPRRAATRWP